MAGFDLVGFAVVLVMVGGLAAVLWEILAKDPQSLLQMMDDSRRFAEAPLAADETPVAGRPATAPELAANANHPRLAA